jgi:hypothetical protein
MRELVDIRTVRISADLPQSERSAEFKRQVDICHCKVGNMVVHNIFPKNAPSLEECLIAMGA